MLQPGVITSGNLDKFSVREEQDNIAALCIQHWSLYLFVGLLESFQTEIQAKKDVNLQQQFSLDHSLAKLNAFLL